MFTHTRLSMSAAAVNAYSAGSITNPMDQLTKLRGHLLSEFTPAYLFGPETDEESRQLEAMIAEEISVDNQFV